MIMLAAGLLHKNLHEFDGCVPMSKSVTYPDLNVISGGLGEGLAEPWRVVECAAGAVCTTPSTIPQWVISIKNALEGRGMTSGITEVVVSNKRG